MLDLLTKGNRYAEQAWLHLEAGDPATAKKWAVQGMTHARVRRDHAAGNPCVLLFALALFSSGDRRRARRQMIHACTRFDMDFDYVGLGVALVCRALIEGKRFNLLAEADAALETGLQRLICDPALWFRVHALRERIAGDVDGLLPAQILRLESR